MHRFVLALVMMTVLMMSPTMVSAASTYDPAGALLPSGAEPATTYELTDGTWVVARNAQSFNSGAAGGNCNKQCWDSAIESHVSVAQWLEWTVEGTRKDWLVLKPGTYATRAFVATVRSNNAVQVSFWADDPADLDPARSGHTISTWYSHSVSDSVREADAHGWKRGSIFNEHNPSTTTLPAGSHLGAGLTYKLWQKIEVTADHPSSDYHGSGKVLLCVTNLKHWVDPATGGFAGGDA